MDTLRSKGHEDAEFTFVKLFTDNAFHFTATSSEVSCYFLRTIKNIIINISFTFVFQYIQINVKANSIDDEVSKEDVMNPLVKLLESSEFNLLETLHTEYVQRKQLLPGNLPKQNFDIPQ